jgi:hypothetical protein
MPIEFMGHGGRAGRAFVFDKKKAVWTVLFPVYKQCDEATRRLIDS